MNAISSDLRTLENGVAPRKLQERERQEGKDRYLQESRDGGAATKIRATSCARGGIIRYATATVRLLRALLNLVMNAH